MSDGRLPVRPRWIGWTIGVLITLLVLTIGWIVVRGIGAAIEMQNVARNATELRSAISAGDIDRARPVADRIERHAAAAKDLTSDPVWRAFEIVPWLGANFTAMREVADVTDGVAVNAVAPVLAAAESVDLATLGFADGVLNAEALGTVHEPLAHAAATLADAESRVLQIDADGTLPPFADAIRQLRSSVTEAAAVVGGLHGASVLLPGMMGNDAPRSYVVVLQNNAELRSSGGTVGSLALVRAENGRLSIARQASARDFPALETPLELSESTVALFQDGPGRELQNATSIPDFAEAAPIIAARWQQRFGDTVDGVIAIDAVVLQHLVAAFGSVEFAGLTVDKDSVLDVLLSEIHATVPDPVARDSVFAQATASLFRAALAVDDPTTLIGALATAAGEHRIRIWSAHEQEQLSLADTTLGGGLPQDGPHGVHVGVLFNDATGGKMDTYTRASIGTAIGTCHGEPTTQVTVTWRNTAPADAATTLPASVTAAGASDVEPGSVRTRIAIYGPEGDAPAVIEHDGAEQPAQTAVLGTRNVVQQEVLVAPGESTTITVRFTGEGAGERLTRVEHTPLLVQPELTRDELECR